MIFSFKSRLLLPFVCLILSTQFLAAQYNYTGAFIHSNGEFVRDLEDGPDGGMLFLIQHGMDSSLVSSLDSIGNQVWSKSISGVYEELMVASDGSIFLTEPDAGNVNLTKLDVNGNVIWHESIPFFIGPAENFAAAISSQDNIVITGSFFDFFAGLSNRVTMVDGSNGNSLWAIQGGGFKVMQDISATSDGGSLLLAYDFSPNPAPGGTVYRLDSLGNLVWAKEYPGQDGIVRGIVETTQGDLVMQVDTLGIDSNGVAPTYLLRLDSAGNFKFGFEIADSTISGVGITGVFFNSMSPTLEDGVLFGGFRQEGDIQPIYRPKVFHLGANLSSSYMAGCFGPDFQPINLIPTTKVTALGEPGDQDYGYAINNSTTFNSASRVAFAKKQSVAVSSCNDCILKFSSFQGLGLDSISVQFAPAVIGPVTQSIITLPVNRNTINFCLECIEQIAGGFTSQQTGDTIAFTSTMINTDSLVWDLGDGTTSNDSTPTHVYANPGTYTVCLTGYGLCDTLDTCEVVTILVGVEDAWTSQIEVYPVPAQTHLMVRGPLGSGTQLRLLNLQGKMLKQTQLTWESTLTEMEVNGLASGLYWLEISDGVRRAVRQVEVMH